MKFVACLQGTYGDILPTVGILERLKSDGYSVAIITNDQFRDVAEKYGVEFYSLGSKKEYELAYHSESSWTEEWSRRHFLQFHFPVMESTYLLLKEMHEEGKSLFVLYSSPISGAKMACDEYSIPHAQLVLSPSVLHSNASPAFPLRVQVESEKHAEYIPKLVRRHRSQLMSELIEPYVNPLRKRLGLVPWGSQNIPSEHSADNVIAMFPEWFRPPADDWPIGAKYFNFPQFDVVDNERRQVVDDYLKENNNPIIFTKGTGVPFDSRYYGKALAICKILRRPGLYVCKNISNSDPSTTELLTVINYVDFRYLFERSSIVIHHGGIGTIAQALAAGIPQLILPITFDQPDNSYWLWRLGVSNALDSDVFRVDYAVAEIERLISCTKVRAKLKRVRASMKNDCGLSSCKEHLLQVSVKAKSF